MPRATNKDGSLAPLTAFNSQKNCIIYTPCGNICLKILPEITDSKAANYAQENAIGRSNPIITYAYSDPRMINTELHFMTTTTQDINDNWTALKIIQSLVYPQGATADNISPYTPPPVVRFVCGDLMDGADGLCLILRNYNVRYPTDVAWDYQTFLPYKFSISCGWEVVYACADLPSNNCVLCNGSSTDCQPLFPGPAIPSAVLMPKGGGGGSSNSFAPKVGFVKKGVW